MARLDRRDLLAKWKKRQEAYEKLETLYKDADDDCDPDTADIPGADEPDAVKQRLYHDLKEICMEFVKDLSLL